MNKVFLVAAACMLLVGCSGKQFFFLPIGSGGGTCPERAYCTDVREVSTYSVTYNLTTVSDSRGPDPNAYYQVLT